MAHPKGSKVRQIVPVIEGEVVKTEFNEDAGCLQYLVEYGHPDSPDGAPHQRWFLESQVEAA